MTRSRPILIAAASAIFVAVLGALMTDLGPWYAGLKQPAWKPPDWAFGPIWTTIFALAAAAGVIGWRRAPSRADRERLLALFEVPLLWLSVMLLIVVLARYAKPAAWLLAPYLAWVTIAALLNWQTVKLNGPFGAG